MVVRILKIFRIKDKKPSMMISQLIVNLPRFKIHPNLVLNHHPMALSSGVFPKKFLLILDWSFSRLVSLRIVQVLNHVVGWTVSRDENGMKKHKLLK